MSRMAMPEEKAPSLLAKLEEFRLQSMTWATNATVTQNLEAVREVIAALPAAIENDKDIVVRHTTIEDHYLFDGLSDPEEIAAACNESVDFVNEVLEPLL